MRQAHLDIRAKDGVLADPERRLVAHVAQEIADLLIVYLHVRDLDLVDQVLVCVLSHVSVYASHGTVCTHSIDAIE